MSWQRELDELRTRERMASVMSLGVAEGTTTTMGTPGRRSRSSSARA